MFYDFRQYTLKEFSLLRVTKKKKAEKMQTIPSFSCDLASCPHSFQNGIGEL